MLASLTACVVDPMDPGEELDGREDKPGIGTGTDPRWMDDYDREMGWLMAGISLTTYSDSCQYNATWEMGTWKFINGVDCAENPCGPDLNEGSFHSFLSPTLSPFRSIHLQVQSPFVPVLCLVGPRYTNCGRLERQGHADGGVTWYTSISENSVVGTPWKRLTTAYVTSEESFKAKGPVPLEKPYYSLSQDFYIKPNPDGTCPIDPWHPENGSRL